MRVGGGKEGAASFWGKLLMLSCLQAADVGSKKLGFSKGINRREAETGTGLFPEHKLHSQPPSLSHVHRDL